MIKHVVCFKLAEPSEAACLKCKEVLLSMVGNVPMIRDIEVGVDVLHSPRSYDVYLSVTVDDRAALDAYQSDKYHCEVVKTHMHAVTASSVAVDFEI